MINVYTSTQLVSIDNTSQHVIQNVPNNKILYLLYGPDSLVDFDKSKVDIIYNNKGPSAIRYNNKTYLFKKRKLLKIGNGRLDDIRTGEDFCLPQNVLIQSPHIQQYRKNGKINQFQKFEKVLYPQSLPPYVDINLVERKHIDELVFNNIYINQRFFIFYDLDKPKGGPYIRTAKHKAFCTKSKRYFTLPLNLFVLPYNKYENY